MCVATTAPTRPIPFSYPPVIAPKTSFAHGGDGVSLHKQHRRNQRASYTEAAGKLWTNSMHFPQEVH